MEIRPIRTEADYDAALAEIERYFESEPKRGSPEADRFEVLLALIGAYENQHWRINAPNPVDAIRAVMMNRGFTQTDLAELLGSKSRASEILSRKRSLTLNQIRRLRDEWHVPAESLVNI
jgi:HTH-type transcriptional regulator/antitoxin HigA